ncbi:MAG: hypothetical protein ACM3MK_04130, partial [Chitinophagales bacterium]
MLTATPRRRNEIIIAIVLVVVVAIAAGLAWTLSDRIGSSSTTAAVRPTPTQNPPRTVAENPPPAAPSGETLKSIDQLRQQVKDLDAARQDLSQKVKDLDAARHDLLQQLDATKRQLSETQG